MDLGHRTCLVVGPINQSTRPGASVIPPSYALDNLRSLRVELVGVALVGLLLALRDSGLPHVSTAHTHTPHSFQLLGRSTIPSLCKHSARPTSHHCVAVAVAVAVG